MKRLVTLFIALLVAVSAAPAQNYENMTGKEMLLGDMDPEWQEIVAALEDLRHVPGPDKGRDQLLARAAKLRARRDKVANGQEPVAHAWDRYTLKQADYRAKRKALDAEWAEYDKDAADQVAAGGGQSFEVTDPRLAMLNAWAARLAVKKAELDQKEIPVKKLLEELKADVKVLDAQVDRFCFAWRDDAADFIHDAAQFVALRQIDAKIAKLERQMALDRKALSYYKDRLPGLHADIEKMALQADQTREEGALKAVDLGVGAILDRLSARSDATIKTTRAQMKALKESLVRYGIRPDDIKRAFRAETMGSDSVLGIRTRKKLYEELSMLKDISSAYDNTTKQQYWEAIAECLKVFVQHPGLKLLVTDFEVTANLLYVGASWATATDRVAQYAKMSEKDLKAVATLSRVYQTHVLEHRDLKKLRDELLQPGRR